MQEVQREAGVVAEVVEEVKLGQVVEEVHKGPMGQQQPAYPSRELLTLVGLQRETFTR